MQSVPYALIKLIEFFNGPNLMNPTNTQKVYANITNEKVTFHDARKNNPGSFHKTGFTLIQLEKEPMVQGIKKLNFLLFKWTCY